MVHVLVVERRVLEGVDANDQLRGHHRTAAALPLGVGAFDECAEVDAFLPFQDRTVGVVDVLQEITVALRMTGLGVLSLDALTELAQFDVLRDGHGVLEERRLVGALRRSLDANAGIQEGLEPLVEVVFVCGQLGQEQDRTAHFFACDLQEQFVLHLDRQALEHAVADVFKTGELLDRSGQQRRELFASVVPLVLQPCLCTLAEAGRASLEQQFGLFLANRVYGERELETVEEAPDDLAVAARDGEVAEEPALRMCPEEPQEDQLADVEFADLLHDRDPVVSEGALLPDDLGDEARTVADGNHQQQLLVVEHVADEVGGDAPQQEVARVGVVGQLGEGLEVALQPLHSERPRVTVGQQIDGVDVALERLLEGGGRRLARDERLEGRLNGLEFFHGADGTGQCADDRCRHGTASLSA